ncbi:MAG: hypothetical protein ACJ8GW_17840 [Massilia sp.]
MIQLPAPLEPWRAWLSLFAQDLVKPLGELLLRLDPQIGALRSAPARADALPEGVGSIVQRGPYERLLISEWAYADAEPDEFLRRAANGELMFTGPEPAARMRSRRCVVLFDAGPMQLGAPRLLHLALYILLARRAEQAGALFEWGVLQAATVLKSDAGENSLRALLQARTLIPFDETARSAWEACIDPLHDDLWVIGGPGLNPPRPLRSQVTISSNLLAEQLDVTLQAGHSQRALSLPLPDRDVGVRLLRSRFGARASKAEMRQQDSKPSLLQAPRFGAHGNWMAVAQVDGSVQIFHVPSSTKTQPGKARIVPAPLGASILGAGLFGRSLGVILRAGERLTLRGFGSAGLNDKAVANAPLPVTEQLRIPSQLGAWLPTFFVIDTSNVTALPGDPARPWDLKGKVEKSHVLVVDVDGNLTCWSNEQVRNAGVSETSPVTVRTVADRVLGAAQFNHRVYYVRSLQAAGEICAWNATNDDTILGTLPYSCKEVHFGDAHSWHLVSAGLLAVKRDDNKWWVGKQQHWEPIAIDDGAQVLGVARSHHHGANGLVVLGTDRRTIEFRSARASRVLIESAEPIAQASLNPVNGDIAWIGSRTRRVFVQGLDESSPYLQVMSEEAHVE